MPEPTAPAAVPATSPPVARRRWLRWAVALAAALGLFSLLGFLALPAVIKAKVPEYADKVLHRKAAIGELRINPFSLRVEVRDFSLAEADGRPIAGFAGLVVDLEWSSLTRRAWHLAELRLAEPKVSLDIAPDGRINFAALVEDLTRDSPKGEPGGTPRLVIDLLAIERGQAHFSDRRAGYDNTLAPIDLKLEHFSTLPQDKGEYTLSATTARGGVLNWKGEVSLNPIASTGTLVGAKLSLPEIAVYARPFTTVEVASGTAGFAVPYRVSYSDGRLEASVDGAGFMLDALAVKAPGVATPFFGLNSLKVGKVKADYATRTAEAGEVLVEGGKLSVTRDAGGNLDLLALAKPSPALPSQAAAAAEPATWKIGVGQFGLDHFAFALDDRSSPTPLSASIGRVRVKAGLQAETGATMQVRAGGIEVDLHDFSAGGKGDALVSIGHAGLSGGEMDLRERSVKIARVSTTGGRAKVVRGEDGRINLLDLVPGAGTAPAAPAKGKDAAWKATVAEVSLDKYAIDLEDRASGISLGVQDIGARLANVSADPRVPVAISAGFSLREGGRFSIKGHATPAQPALDAELKVERLSLRPVQPLLAKHVRLKVADGTVSLQGRAIMTQAGGKAPLMRFTGGFDVSALKLDEENGEVFAAWNSVGAEALTLTVQPNRLDVPELRIAGLNAKLLIEADRSLNAARLLVRPAGGVSPAKPVSAPQPPEAGEAFPVSVRRVRVQDARLEFADLSLRPQFAAKIHELNGVVNGLSTDKASRSQLELDGRVDEFGLARIRGELNPFAPKDNTDVSVVFRNVDLVSASPYSMKFAGYRIASGKISLDLAYKVRNSALEGKNSVVLDKLTLGEKVDSPDAINLPLELALAILKDSDGKIDLDLPVSGSLDDPQFSYGAVIWKAVVNVVTKIVTAPFRALGALFGISGDKLESIDFDAGSAKLLPPEREKLKQVAAVLAKRAQLGLAVPGRYSEAADGEALKVRAVRLEVARRAGIKVAEGEEPGPADLQDTAVRAALRALLTERFGAAEWDKRKVESEQAAAKSGAPISVLQRAQRLARGEPQVADLGPLYRGIVERLNQAQPLAADALQQLARQRSDAIVSVLKASGVDAARLTQPANEKSDAAPGKPFPLKLGLSSR